MSQGAFFGVKNKAVVHGLFHTILIGSVIAAVTYRPITGIPVEIQHEGCVVLSALILIFCYWGLQYEKKTLRFTWFLLLLSILAAGIHTVAMIYLYDSIIVNWKPTRPVMIYVHYELIKNTACYPFLCSGDDIASGSF